MNRGTHKLLLRLTNIQCSKGREQNFGNFSNYIVKLSYHLIYTYRWYKSSLFACTRPALSFSFSIYLPYLRVVVASQIICDVTDVHYDAKKQSAS